MSDDERRPTFFQSQGELRGWFARNHGREDVLWIGFYKIGTGRPSVTYPEALDEALSVGWIDGVRKKRDTESYIQRFTPRRAGSVWSQVNIRKVEALLASGRMKRPGLDAFERRTAARQHRYSYENQPARLPLPLARRFRQSADAWTFFQAQAPWYRRTAIFWVSSAARPETRDRRLAQLIDDSAAGRRLSVLSPGGKSAKKR